MVILAENGTPFLGIFLKIQVYISKILGICHANTQKSLIFWKANPCLGIFLQRRISNEKVNHIWFGWGCAAQVLKPIHISHGHFRWKWYPISRDLSQNIGLYFSILVFAIQTPKNPGDFEKQTHVWGYFFRECDPCPRISHEKVTHIWFGWGCAAQVLKPIPISHDHSCWKWYPFLGIFLQI